MSIIYDALKKADKDGDKNQGVKEVDPDKKQPQKDFSWVRLLFSVLGLAVIVTLTLVLLQQNKVINIPVIQKLVDLPAQLKKNSKATGKAKSPAKAKSAAAKSKAAAQPQKPKEYAANKYILEGIIYDPVAPSAVINGEIIKKQDKIGEYEVVDITAESVTLRNLNDSTTMNLSL